jgi:hypothetical protein
MLASTSLPSDLSGLPDSLGYHLPYSFPVAATARFLAHADLNGDGKEDLILVGQSSHMRERAIQVLEGNGDGTFREGVTIELQNPTRAIAVADVNGDGKPDLILLHSGVTFLLNTTPSPGAPVSFGSEQSLVGGFGPALAAADLNGDGRAEVLLGTTPSRDASDEEGTLRVVSAPAFVDANHHSGSAPAIDVPIPGVPVSIVVSDFDGDGKPDVAVGFTGPLHERRGGVAILLNRTENSASPIRFADPLLINFDHAVDFVASADLNGDGRNDLFAAWCAGREQPCGALSLLDQPTPEGGVRFTSQSVPLTVQRASNWMLRDINHDGKPDLLFLSRQEGVAFPVLAPGEIVVAFGLGGGRFAPPRTLSLYFLGNAIKAAAFPDVANPRKITRASTHRAMSAAFPHDAITGLLASLGNDARFNTIAKLSKTESALMKKMSHHRPSRIARRSRYACALVLSPGATLISTTSQRIAVMLS